MLSQGSHTSQMRKFRGISRVIKGSTAQFQVDFCKTVVTLIYVNKISSNLAHLFEDLFWSMQHSKEVSIIFPKKTLMTEQYEILREKKISVLIYFCVFHKFQGDSRFLYKIPGCFQGSRSQNKFQAFQGFQGAMGTLCQHSLLLTMLSYDITVDNK